MCAVIAEELIKRFPMLRVKVYDAEAKRKSNFHEAEMQSTNRAMRLCGLIWPSISGQAI
jgi:hypothetical protein